MVPNYIHVFVFFFYYPYYSLLVNKDLGLYHCNSYTVVSRIFGASHRRPI